MRRTDIREVRLRVTDTQTNPTTVPSLRMRAEGNYVLTASGKPAEVDVVIANGLRVYEEKHIFSLGVGAGGCLGLCVVDIELIVVEEIALPEGEVRGSEVLNM